MSGIDDPVLQLALRVKLVTPAQLEDAKKLQALLGQNGFPLSVSEILIKKEFLNPDQIRLLKLAVQVDQSREEDQAEASLLIRNGIITEEKAKEALSTQEAAYQEGKIVPRLQEILQKKGYLDAQQLQRAKQQSDSSKSLTVPPASGEGSQRRRESSIRQLVEGCKVGMRKTSIKDPAGQDRTLFFLDIEGTLDGHTFKHFDDFLHNLINEGRFNLILNCEKLEYLSSAGIGVLAGAVKRCRDGKGDLRLCSVQEKVKKIINLVGLQSMLRMYDSDRGAMVSFKYM
jgi:anti-sigma B factor antagonist